MSGGAAAPASRRRRDLDGAADAPPAAGGCAFHAPPRGLGAHPPGAAFDRHRHLAAHLMVVLNGAMLHVGYGGRHRLMPGDVLLHPTLEAHHGHVVAGRDARVLYLPWGFEPGFGGVYRPPGIDAVVRSHAADPVEAAGLMAEAMAGLSPLPAPVADWPDLLSARLRLGPARIARWAAGNGLARETVARGFRRAYGVSPVVLCGELRARRSWVRVVSGREPLAAIAADEGYSDQSHMSRAVRAFTGAPPRDWRHPSPRTVTMLQDSGAQAPIVGHGPAGTGADGDRWDAADRPGRPLLRRHP